MLEFIRYTWTEIKAATYDFFHPWALVKRWRR